MMPGGDQDSTPRSVPRFPRAERHVSTAAQAADGRAGERPADEHHEDTGWATPAARSRDHIWAVASTSAPAASRHGATAQRPRTTVPAPAASTPASASGPHGG